MQEEAEAAIGSQPADSKEEVRAYIPCRRKQMQPQATSLLKIRKR
jgi:hypothetical protein